VARAGHELLTADMHVDSAESTHRPRREVCGSGSMSVTFGSGVARSDPEALIATPEETVAAGPGDIDRIIELAENSMRSRSWWGCPGRCRAPSGLRLRRLRRSRSRWSRRRLARGLSVRVLPGRRTADNGHGRAGAGERGKRKRLVDVPSSTRRPRSSSCSNAMDIDAVDGATSWAGSRKSPRESAGTRY
jgi:hypothetical protein